MPECQVMLKNYTAFSWKFCIDYFSPFFNILQYIISTIHIFNINLSRCCAKTGYSSPYSYLTTITRVNYVASDILVTIFLCPNAIFCTYFFFLKRKVDSSENVTLRQLSQVQLEYCMYQATRCCRCLGLNHCFFTFAIYSKRSFCRYRRTVTVDTGADILLFKSDVILSGHRRASPLTKRFK